jgi:tRNA(Arg) A34 adenosine deaminase TadA
MTPTDVRHLRRCLELAWAARARGDEPFGSLLVGPHGAVLAERENAVVTTGDRTAHPELALAGWASAHLSPAERAGSTVYTSCEHCAMCAAGHFWAGLGRLVFAVAGEQLAAVVPAGTPVLALSSREVLSRGSVAVVVEGPCSELVEDGLAVFAGYWA